MIIGDRDLTGDALEAYQQTLRDRLKRREKFGAGNKTNKAIQAVIERIESINQEDNYERDDNAKTGTVAYQLDSVGRDHEALSGLRKGISRDHRL